ncbi:MAG: stage V sporulation protein AE [Eubacteriales bacterium]|nr:stage V sporulation protein AE [Eubacteriales bacterium]
MAIRKAILVTDGDDMAKRAVEKAASNIGARVISMSSGNPTPLSGEKLIELIMQAEHDPVVVMVDDKGQEGKGRGETALEKIIDCDNIDVIGVVAVSSNGKECSKANVTFSVTNDGRIIGKGVDKDGYSKQSSKACGDTVSILSKYKDLLIVGIGDPGKMDYQDEIKQGAPITTKAFREIVNRSILS